MILCYYGVLDMRKSVGFNDHVLSITWCLGSLDWFSLGIAFLVALDGAGIFAIPRIFRECLGC